MIICIIMYYIYRYIQYDLYTKLRVHDLGLEYYV